MKGIKKAAAAVLVVGLGLSNNAQAEPLYNIIDLGTLGGSFSSANAINASGQVTGYSDLATGTGAHAFITSSNGVMSDLGTLRYGFLGNSYGYGINASGQVTGVSDTDCNPGFCPPTAAFSTSKDYPPGSALDMVFGLSDSKGYAINDSGQVTGTFTTIYGFNTHAFVTSSTGVGTDLTALNNQYISEGYGINASGQVTGYSSFNANGTVAFAHHAFITNSNGIMSDLGALDGDNYSAGYAINASGQVTGVSSNAIIAQAFITNSNGVMSALGTFGGVHSIGYGINDYGQVVGLSETTNGSQHAFVTDNGIMKDLNTLLVSSATGWVLSEARGINNAGQITGSGIHNGLNSAFVLTPVAAVPVPAAVWLFGNGLGLLTFANRRQAQSNML